MLPGNFDFAILVQGET